MRKFNYTWLIVQPIEQGEGQDQQQQEGEGEQQAEGDKPEAEKPEVEQQGRTCCTSYLLHLYIMSFYFFNFLFYCKLLNKNRQFALLEIFFFVFC